MKALPIFLVLMFAAGAAGAQMYKWIDKDGKVHYGDTPQPGAKATSIQAPSGGAAPSAPAAPATAGTKDKAAKKKEGPLTPAEQEQEYRQRQADARKEAEKAAAEARDKAARNEGCERTREYLRTLQSGQRIVRSNPSGERYYLDDDQVAQEIAKAQQAEQAACK